MGGDLSLAPIGISVSFCWSHLILCYTLVLMETVVIRQYFNMNNDDKHISH